MLRARGDMAPSVWATTNYFGRLRQRRGGRGECVLVFCGFPNELPPAWWLERTEIYSLTVPEARSPKSQHQLARLPLGAPGENPFLPLSSFQGCWHSLAGAHIPPVSASVNIFTPPLCVRISSCPSSFKSTCDYIQGSPRQSGIVSPSQKPRLHHICKDPLVLCKVAFTSSRDQEADASEGPLVCLPLGVQTERS